MAAFECPHRPTAQRQTKPEAAGRGLRPLQSCCCGPALAASRTGPAAPHRLPQLAAPRRMQPAAAAAVSGRRSAACGGSVRCSSRKTSCACRPALLRHAESAGTFTVWPDFWHSATYLCIAASCATARQLRAVRRPEDLEFSQFSVTSLFRRIRHYKARQLAVSHEKNPLKPGLYEKIEDLLLISDPNAQKLKTPNLFSMTSIFEM